MPSSKEYLSYIMEQLAPLEGITTRQMMGEYIIYYQGKIAAELCDETRRAAVVMAVVVMTVVALPGCRCDQGREREHAGDRRQGDLKPDIAGMYVVLELPARGEHQHRNRRDRGEYEAAPPAAPAARQ